MPEEQVVAFFGRHGSTDLNKEDRYRGQKDVPLDDEGREDAKAQAEALKDQEIGQAWTSPLSRARETSKTVLKGRGIKASSLESLLPLDAGKFTGQKKSDHKEQMEYYHKHTDERIPGGESIDQMHKRVRRPIFRALRAGVRTGKPSYVSTHSSVIHSLGQILHDDHEAALVEPGGVVVVTFDGKNFKAVPIFRPKDEKKETSYAS